MESEQERRPQDEAEEANTGTVPPYLEDPSASTHDDLNSQSEPTQSSAAQTPHLSSSGALENIIPQERPEEAEDLIPLDPDLPIYDKVKNLLETNLRAYLETLKQELNEELGYQMKLDRQEKNLELVELAAKLKNAKKNLEKTGHENEQEEKKRQQEQTKLESTKSRCSKLKERSGHVKAKESKLRTELDKRLQEVAYMQEASKDLHSKAKILNNVKNKAAAEKIQAEDHQNKKALYIDHLTKTLEKLTLEIDMYEVQTGAQTEETQESKEAFFQAEAKLEALLMSQRQLLQQWNRSLKAMRNQHEALSAIQDAASAVEDDLKSLHSEINSYKKSITVEQERNESVTGQLRLCEINCTALKKQISQKQEQQEALQAQHNACVRSMQKAEQNLATFTEEDRMYQDELRGQKKQLEKFSSERLEVEEKIMNVLHQQLINNKAAQALQQLNSKMVLKINKQIHKLQHLENEIACVKLKSEEVIQNNNNQEITLKAIDLEVDEYKKLVASNETEFSSNVRLIFNSQEMISHLQSKIINLESETGHEDLSLPQIEINKLSAETNQLTAHIKHEQRLWMGQQETLVQLTKDLEFTNREMRRLQLEYTGKQQNKIKLENHIVQETREKAELEMNILMLQGDQDKLSNLLSQNKDLSNALLQQNAVMEKDFCLILKAAVQECVSVQMELERTHEETESILESLLEAEQQVLLWDKRTMILEETQSVVDSEMYEEEIVKINAEIHHLELRLAQLNVQKEALMRESEVAIGKTMKVIQRKGALLIGTSRKDTKYENKCSERLKEVIRQKRKEDAIWERVVKEETCSRDRLNEMIVAQEQNLEELNIMNKKLEYDVLHLQDNIYVTNTQIFALQSRNVKLQEVCDGKYKLSSFATDGAAMENQMERLEVLSTTLQQKCEEHPHLQGEPHRVALAAAAFRQLYL